jgi:hypothetical protein
MKTTELMSMAAAALLTGALPASAQTNDVGQAKTDSTAATASTSGGATGTTGSSVTLVPPTEQITGTPSQVTERDALNDQQVEAPRPGNVTLDPSYRGFFPIPNTPVIIQFNAKPRLDAMYDTKTSGNGDRFVTATIPVEGDANFGGGAEFNMTAKGSQLSVDVRAPDMPGNFRFYYNNDFFGSGTGMAYRLKQLYGQFYNITAGFTYSIFEDPDVWPDTVDFEGPNSAIFARQATVRYMIPLSEKWQVNVGLQQPSSDIDTTGHPDVTPANHAPDGGANLRWEDAKLGHVQLAAILRDVGANSPSLGNQGVFGWGINLSGNLNVFSQDSIQAQLTYGDGIFHFCNDNFTYSGFAGGDAAYTSSGSLRALSYLAPMVGYTHHWCDQFRSTITGGYVDLQNEQSQAPNAYHQTVYSSLNVVWQMRAHLSIGLEALYGYKRDFSGANGDVWRFQTGLVYSLF